MSRGFIVSVVGLAVVVVIDVVIPVVVLGLVLDFMVVVVLPVVVFAVNSIFDLVVVGIGFSFCEIVFALGRFVGSAVNV